jgi:flagellar biosynthesis/type III secretory pathway chaperone
MTTPAARDHQSPLETALHDVHATLADLLVAADEQHAAVVAHDSARLESVTRQQERLSARLASAEARRIELTAGVPIRGAVSTLPEPHSARVTSLSASIADAVTVLQQRQADTASLLQQSIDLTGQTLSFLQRLVEPQAVVYGVQGVTSGRGHSLRVDSRA